MDFKEEERHGETEAHKTSCFLMDRFNDRTTERSAFLTYPQILFWFYESKCWNICLKAFFTQRLYNGAVLILVCWAHNSETFQFRNVYSTSRFGSGVPGPLNNPHSAQLIVSAGIISVLYSSKLGINTRTYRALYW